MKVRDFDRQLLWHFRAHWLADDYMDGDTFTVLADTGFSGREEVRVRLEGVFAPELGRSGGMEAREVLRAALSAAGTVPWNLRIVSLQRERGVNQVTTFERFVCTVHLVMGDELIDLKEML